MFNKFWKPRRLVSGFLITFFLVSYAHAYSFIVFGDNRDGDETFKVLINKANQEKGVAFAVNTGDFVSSGKIAQYDHYQALMRQFKFPVYNAMGNHDGVKGGWKIFEKRFGPLYYSFDCQGSRFIIINNAFRESFDREQFNWLKNVIATGEVKHKFVFMHKPVFDPSEIYKDYIMSGRAVTEELVRLFTKYKVDYVFAGHIHGYAKSVRDGVTYIVTAGGGAPLYLPPEFGGYYHFVRVDVENGAVKDTVIRVYE